MKPYCLVVWSGRIRDKPNRGFDPDGLVHLSYAETLIQLVSAKKRTTALDRIRRTPGYQPRPDVFRAVGRQFYRVCFRNFLVIEQAPIDADHPSMCRLIGDFTWEEMEILLPALLAAAILLGHQPSHATGHLDSAQSQVQPWLERELRALRGH